MDNVINIDEVYTPLDRIMDQWKKKYNIPEHTLGALARYKLYGYKPGSFLMAVLCNDLFEAMGRADIENRYALHEICKLVYNEIPANAWHNEDRVYDYMKNVREQNGKNSG